MNTDDASFGMGASPQPSTGAAVNWSELPLFPLGTVLFPQGILPLQIFEVRYLDMIGRAYKAGTPFGVVSLVKGSEVRTRTAGSQSEGFAPEAFADVGTLAHILEFTAPRPGLIQIVCTGGERFRIQQRRQLKHGLWVAQATPIAPDPDTPIPSDLLPVAHTLSALIEAQQRGETPMPLPLMTPYRLDDCAWVANRWCDLLPMAPGVKQSLLQLDNPLLRLELVGDLLGSK